MKNWIKEHIDTLAIVGSVVGAIWTLKSDMNSLEHRLTCQMQSMDLRLTNQIHDLDKRLTAIETIMIMQGAPIRALAQEVDKSIDTN